MTETVSFLTVETGTDLVIGFAVMDPDDPGEVESLILQRTPEFEAVLEPHERGVKVSFERFDAEEEDLLEAADWSEKSRVLRLETKLRTYELDLRRLDPSEWEGMRKTLMKMNFDESFRLSDALTMSLDGYDADVAPQRDEWLATDEIERLLLVQHYHRRVRANVPKRGRRLHATFHVIVENQLAMNTEPVVRALARLMKEGLSRHDAIHAIASVLSANVYDSLQAQDAGTTANARYYAELERLTAASWRKEYGDG